MIARAQRAGAIVCLAAAAAASSCGAARLRLPAGPGTPAADGADALAAATVACRALSSLTAEASVGGSAGGRRLRARLILGLQEPASARLEAIGPFARPLFVLAARDGSATLVLNDDNRVLEGGRPADVLEALTGVALDPGDLLEALTGCPAGDLAAAEGRRLGDEWRLLQDGRRAVYLHRESDAAPWRLVAAVFAPANAPEWRAEYRAFADGLPRTVRFVSSDPDRFDLRLALSGLEIDPPLPAAAFEVRIPAAAQPISLEELRRAGPLGDGSR